MGAGEPSRPPPGGVPLGAWSGSDATDRLHASLVAFAEASDRQTRQIFWLTRALVLLTVALVIGLIVQIALA